MTRAEMKQWLLDAGKPIPSDLRLDILRRKTAKALRRGQS